MAECIEKTKNNTGITFNMAINYGGGEEIVHAVKNIATQVKNGNLDIEQINDQTIENNL